MKLSTQSYKGTRDFYPDDMRFRRWMFTQMRKVVESFGYQEYDGPLLEAFELYAAKSGEELVNQQLYRLKDKGDRDLVIRPEMTPTLARMVAGKINELVNPIRWYSLPNLWRYERPQRGRLREHWQLNVDVLGGSPLLADTEIINVALEVMRKFGGEKHISIRINNRKLMDQLFRDHFKIVEDVSQRIMRIIDARSKLDSTTYQLELKKLGMQENLIGELESFFKLSLDDLGTFLPGKGQSELKNLFVCLKDSEILNDQVELVFDPTIMRGMNYYTGTVFEIMDRSPENKRAMFGGGRYDNLIGLFGKNQLSGVGFGMGDVTFQNFLEIHQLVPDLESAIDVFVSLPENQKSGEAAKLSQRFRDKGIRAATSLEVGGFSTQLKLASRLKAKFIILFGEQESHEGKFILKDLGKKEQRVCDFDTALQEVMVWKKSTLLKS